MKHLATSALLISLLIPMQASSAQIPASGATEIYLSAFGVLTDGLGLTVTPTGNFELVSISAIPSPSVFYDITGFDSDLGRIYHEGVGLDLAAGGTTLSLENFIVDAGAGIVFGDVSGPGVSVADAPLFDLVSCVPDGCQGLDMTLTIAGFGLDLSATAANVLTQVFGVDDLTGTQIGVANSIVIVPEPAIVGMVLLSLAALPLLRRRSA